MRVRPLGREDPLKEGMATHSSVVAWRLHAQRSLEGFSLCSQEDSDTAERLRITTNAHPLLSLCLSLSHTHTH